MSVAISSRRLAQSRMSLYVPLMLFLIANAVSLLATALKPFAPIPHPLLPFITLTFATRRTLLERFLGRKKPAKEFLDPSDPNLLKQKPPGAEGTPIPKRGDLDSSSIFDEAAPKAKDVPQALYRDPISMAAALDPKPMARKRWQRKMVIKDIQQRYRLSKTKKILRTERSHMSKSPMFKTSVKKLGPLARQIAGKPIEEAMVQMRFSAKKAAADVLKQLRIARDEAMVSRGMGLGLGPVKVDPTTRKAIMPSKDTAEEFPGMVVEDKKGKRRFVSDKTNIYVDQAWVGRGRYTKKPEYRARGNMNILMSPTTSESSLLALCSEVCEWLTDGTFRHFGCAQGRIDEDTISGGEGAEAAEEKGMGAVEG